MPCDQNVLGRSSTDLDFIGHCAMVTKISLCVDEDHSTVGQQRRSLNDLMKSSHVQKTSDLIAE